MWLVERDSDMSRESLVFAFYRCKEEALRRDAYNEDSFTRGLSKYSNSHCHLLASLHVDGVYFLSAVGQNVDSGRSTPNVTSAPSRADSGVASHATGSSAPSPTLAAQGGGSNLARSRPPYNVTAVCRLCFRSGQKSVKDPKREDRCAGACVLYLYCTL